MPTYKMLTRSWMTDANGEQRVFEADELIDLGEAQAEYLLSARIIVPEDDPPSWSVQGGASADDFVINQFTGLMTSTVPIDQGEYVVEVENENGPDGPQLLRVTITVEDITE